MNMPKLPNEAFILVGATELMLGKASTLIPVYEIAPRQQQDELPGINTMEGWNARAFMGCARHYIDAGGELLHELDISTAARRGWLPMLEEALAAANSGGDVEAVILRLAKTYVGIE